MITWDMSQLHLSSRCKLKGECATHRAVITRFGHYVKSTSKLGAIPGVLVCTVFTAFMHACVWLSVCRLPPFTYSVEMSNSYNTFRLYWSPWGNESSAFNPIQTHNYTDTQNLTWAAWGRNRGICRLSLIVISLPTSCHWPTSPGGGTCLPFYRLVASERTRDSLLGPRYLWPRPSFSAASRFLDWFSHSCDAIVLVKPVHGQTDRRTKSLKLSFGVAEDVSGNTFFFFKFFQMHEAPFLMEEVVAPLFCLWMGDDKMAVRCLIKGWVLIMFVWIVLLTNGRGERGIAARWSKYSANGTKKCVVSRRRSRCHNDTQCRGRFLQQIAFSLSKLLVMKQQLRNVSKAIVF